MPKDTVMDMPKPEDTKNVSTKKRDPATVIPEQQGVFDELMKVISIFQASEGELRPHGIVTGPSGSGKSHLVALACQLLKVGFLEVNAAQITSEGISGNSLSRALEPLRDMQQQLVVCFVDEFDKLFVSGNSNTQTTAANTSDVQNEFLKVLESDHTSVIGQYGHFDSVKVSNVLFLFAGAFNGEPEISIEKLRSFGIKTEFLGRVGLVYNCVKPSLESLMNILEQSRTLHMYLELTLDSDKDHAMKTIGDALARCYDNNTLGVRMIDSLIHTYFIKGGKIPHEIEEKVTFQKKINLMGTF